MACSATAADLEPKTFKAKDGTEVLYRIAEPAKIETGKKYPLVLFLHGSGERGNDNKDRPTMPSRQNLGSIQLRLQEFCR